MFLKILIIFKNELSFFYEINYIAKLCVKRNFLIKRFDVIEILDNFEVISCYVY